MTRTSAGTMRAYNQLRAEQAERTRVGILEATLRVMARGVASVSIPAVAREAGGSIPAVYRHFGTKQDLLAAVYLGSAEGTVPAHAIEGSLESQPTSASKVELSRRPRFE